MGCTRSINGPGVAGRTLLDGSSGRFIRSARESLDRPLDLPRSGRACIFAEEPYSAPCLVMSDIADERGDACLPVVTDFRVPGWVRADVVAILVTGRPDSPGLGSVLGTLISRGCRVYCVSPDGPLADACSGAGGTHVPIPAGDMAEAYGSIAGSLAALLQALGTLRSRDALDEALGSVCSDPSLDPSVPGDLDRGYLAFYSTSDVRALAMGWRAVIGNATSRPCFSGELPEYDHNELVGWSDPNGHAMDIRMVVLRGCRREGLVSDIVGCMLEVLEENGREVTVVDVGDGDAAHRDMRGLAAAFATSDSIGGAVRWTGPPAINCTISWTTWRRPCASRRRTSYRTTT